MTAGPFRAALCILGIAGAVSEAAAQAAPYPVDRVTLVTHSSPDGGSDVFLRECERAGRRAAPCNPSQWRAG